MEADFLLCPVINHRLSCLRAPFAANNSSGMHGGAHLWLRFTQTLFVLQPHRDEPSLSPVVPKPWTQG